MPGLRHASSELGTWGEAVALDHRHAVEVIGEHTGGQQAGHAPTNDHGLIAEGGVAASDGASLPSDRVGRSRSARSRRGQVYSATVRDGPRPASRVVAGENGTPAWEPVKAVGDMREPSTTAASLRKLSTTARLPMVRWMVGGSRPQAAGTLYLRGEAPPLTVDDGSSNPTFTPEVTPE